MSQDIINIIAGGFGAVIGWVLKVIWDAIQELQKDLHQVEVDLPKNYVQKDDLDKRMKHIEDMFQRIYDKLDNKADKNGI